MRYLLLALLLTGCARGFTVMHTTEIVATTGFADHLGHKLFPHAPWWFVPAYGALGCGLYRKLEGGNPHDRLRKFGLDLSGILFNEVLEKL